MRTVLLVEDYAPLATVMAVALRRLGHEVVCAHSARVRGALGVYDVAIMELDLVEGCGIDLARELLRSGRVARVVFYTASRDDALLGRAANLGAVVCRDAGLDVLLRVIEEGWGPASAQVREVNGPEWADPSRTSGTRPRVR